jgi:hypothetical protein
VYFSGLSWHSSGETEENYEHQSGWPEIGKDSNQILPKFKSRALIPQQPDRVGRFTHQVFLENISDGSHLILSRWLTRPKHVELVHNLF